jgi:hypothetical protein
MASLRDYPRCGWWYIKPLLLPSSCFFLFNVSAFQDSCLAARILTRFGADSPSAFASTGASDSGRASDTEFSFLKSGPLPQTHPEQSVIVLDVGCRSEPSLGCTSTDSVYTLLVEIQLIKITDGTLLSALVFAKLPTFHILPIFYCTLQQQQFTSSSIFLQN